MSSKKKLNRPSDERNSLRRNLVRSLFTCGRVRTTIAKARLLRRWAEPLVTCAREGTVAARRRLLVDLGSRTLVKRVVDEIAPLFAQRPGGYLRLIKLPARKSDGSDMALVEFVEAVKPMGQEEREKELLRKGTHRGSRKTTSTESGDSAAG